MAGRHWLVTAFEPFGGRPENNSEAVLNEIFKGNHSLEIQLHRAVLPVRYDDCFSALLDSIDHLKQQGIHLEGILALGEGAEEFKLEMQANNWDDVPDFPDNAGLIKIGTPIFEDLSPEETIPLRFPFEAFTRIRSSNNPGFFVCNHLCAQMGRHFGPDPDSPWFGFIHVPRTGSGGLFTPDVCAAVILGGLRKVAPPSPRTSK